MEFIFTHYCMALGLVRCNKRFEALKYLRSTGCHLNQAMELIRTMETMAHN